MIESKLPLRSEIGNQYKWKLEDIYSDDSLWEEDFGKIDEMHKSIIKFSGQLNKSGDILLQCFTQNEKLFSLVEKLYCYARMRRDEDNSNSKYQAMTDRAEILYMKAGAAVSFIEPEIISMDEEVLNGFCKSTKGLALYEFYISQILRLKKHVLSEKEEKLLALSHEATNTSDEVFTMFNNADIKFPTIKDENGQDVELTKGRYTMFLESKDRRVRQDAFKAMYETYNKYKNTLAACLAGNVKSNRFYATVRNYESCLLSALASDNVDVLVYNELIATINNNLPVLGRYLNARKKALKLQELHIYDLYVPMVEQPQKSYSFNEAKELVYQAMAPLGEEYQSLVRTAYESGWIDVYENQGKTSGGFSWGTYLTHPYILLNWQGTINDVFTLAHELGHAIHSYYSNKSQPHVYASYRIFVAEVASTVNENLLMHYMLSKVNDKGEKAFLLNHQLEEFRTTVFRQVMFAEFEKEIHAMFESGESLTCEALCDKYYGLNEKYFTPHVNVDKEIEIEWSRIPHFYSSFYVYKYATGFSAAVALSQSIVNEGDTAVQRYLDFLKSGGSDYPIEILKKAGVDLSTPEPVQAAMTVFENVLSELEKLI